MGDLTPNRPPASSEIYRRRMQRQARRDTRPELALRAALHAMGLRYRVDVAPIAGMRRRADVVFRRARVAVYVDGCFWHACPLHGTKPKANGEWWAAKLQANRCRDAQTDDALAAAGWASVRVWEHDEPTEAAHWIGSLVRDRHSRLADPRTHKLASAGV